MTLSVRRHATAQEFLDTAEEWLLRREAEHNLILSLARRLLEPSDAYGAPIYYATVENDGGLAGCALRTPPFKLIVTQMTQPAAIALADDLAQVYEEIPGLVGEAETMVAVGSAFCARRGGSVAIDRYRRIYELKRLIPLETPVPGTMRTATLQELDLVTAWVEAFNSELHLPAHAARALAHERITNGNFALWELDDRVVCMAAVTGETPNGARVGFVYTPPTERGHGYATVCVAALSQSLLDSGKQFCFLFTDLANPTSNSIYQRIGYTPVCDVVDCIIERSAS